MCKRCLESHKSQLPEIYQKWQTWEFFSPTAKAGQSFTHNNVLALKEQGNEVDCGGVGPPFYPCEGYVLPLY